LDDRCGFSRVPRAGLGAGTACDLDDRSGPFVWPVHRSPHVGLIYNRVLEGGGAVVGDSVSITLDIEMTRKIG
jgi:hypothetical protein